MHEQTIIAYSVFPAIAYLQICYLFLQASVFQMLTPNLVNGSLYGNHSLPTIGLSVPPTVVLYIFSLLRGSATHIIHSKRAPWICALVYYPILSLVTSNICFNFWINTEYWVNLFIGLSIIIPTFFPWLGLCIQDSFRTLHYKHKVKCGLCLPCTPFLPTSNLILHGIVQPSAIIKSLCKIFAATFLFLLPQVTYYLQPLWAYCCSFLFSQSLINIMQTEVIYLYWYLYSTVKTGLFVVSHIVS